MPEQFKDSPLGRIPKGWRSTTLGEVADYINGFAFKPHHWRETGLPIIRIAQMLDPLEPADRCPVAIPERHVVQDGELLFSWSATLAVVVWDRGPALVNQHIFRVVPRGGIHRNFLYHLLAACMDRLAAQSHGTTMKHVTRGDLLPFAVVIPPEDEQCRIADILDTVDDAIRQTERVIAKLEQVKAGMLQDLLTRGIDDNGEVRDPERYPEQFKDSPLGRIPKGWRSTTLGEVADYINGFAFKPHHWRESGLPIIRIAQMLDPLESVDRCPVAIPERHVVQDGELLFSWSATLAVVVWDRGPALVNQHIFRVVPRGGIRRNFLYHLLSASMDRLAAQSHGTTMKHVTRGDLLPFAVVIPPEDEQHRIAERLDQHEAQVRREGETLAKLRATKQALADDLLTGRIRVNPREAVPA